MASSLSNLVDNLSEGIHKTKYKYDAIIKTTNNAKSNTKIASAILNI